VRGLESLFQKLRKIAFVSKHSFAFLCEGMLEPCVVSFPFPERPYLLERLYPHISRDGWFAAYGVGPIML
jgi:hypothetical protein